MKDTEPQLNMPIPARQLQWFAWFWHAVYFGMLALMLGPTLWNARAALGWRELSLTGLVLAQAALYVGLIFIPQTWPRSRWRLALYFLSSLGLWLLECQLYPHFFWLISAYLGQMYGMLPPVVVIPGIALFFFLLAGQVSQWNLSRLHPGEVFGFAMGWLSSTVTYLFFYRIMGINIERGQLIAELKAAKAEIETAHQRDAELAVLRERERLARELHDSLGHALVTLSVQLEAVQRLYRVDAERASAQIDTLKTLTRHSMEDLRRSLDGLRAPGLGDRQLREALQTLCAEMSQRFNLSIECHLSDSVDSLSMVVAEVIWRVMQEALTNVGKHAHARRVNVNLEIQAGTAVLRVTDDGRGLPGDAESRPGHYGLRGMRERVEGLGGTLRLAASRGGGTTLEVYLPLMTQSPPVLESR